MRSIFRERQYPANRCCMNRVMTTWDIRLAGRLDRTTITSELLRGNPLGDPHDRPLWIYTPPGYDDSDERYPSIYVLQGYGAQVEMWANRQPFQPTYPEMVDDLFAGSAPGCVVVYVDAWTRYGGSQFVDSPGTGRYHSYLCDEIVPFVDARYRTIDAPASRAVTGKSSGGFGAMITPMYRPDLFGAFATHAGDAGYETSYLHDIGTATRHLRAFDGDIMAWWADFTGRRPFSNPADMSLIMWLGCSSAFSADPDGTARLPFDPRTGTLRPDVWQRWLDVDPVRMVDRYADALRGLTSIWIDAGKNDNYFLDLGATALRAGLSRIGVPDDRIHFELFDGTHDGITYRYPMALSWLAGRLARG